MTKTVEAIYDAGVLRPLEALPFPDQQRVRVTVETLDAASGPQGQSTHLDRLIRRLQQSTFAYGGPLPLREELHERGEHI